MHVHLLLGGEEAQVQGALLDDETVVLQDVHHGLHDHAGLSQVVGTGLELPDLELGLGRLGGGTPGEDNGNSGGDEHFFRA